MACSEDQVPCDGWPCDEAELRELDRFEPQTWARDQQTGDPVTKLLLIVLAERANDHGVCWPSQDRLAKDMEVSTRTVRRHTERLLAVGLIFRRFVYRDGRRLRTEYVLSVALPAKLAGSQPDTGGTTTGHGGQDYRPMVSGCNYQGTTKELPNDARALDRFAEFWSVYPARGGRKIGRAKSEAIWRKLSDPDRAAALTGAKTYASERGGVGQVSPKDPERWLRDRCWGDFQPATAEQSNGASEGLVNYVVRMADYELNDRGQLAYTLEERRRIVAQCVAEFGERPSERYRPNVGATQ